jgi:hypothetical protein
MWTTIWKIGRRLADRYKERDWIMNDYIKPENVTSPRHSWTLTHVLEDGAKPDSHEERVAICIGKWEDEPVLGMRWNGTKDSPIGTPQSRGLPTWFIIPSRLQDAVIKTLSADNQRLVNTLLASGKA